jgi:transposase
MSSSPRSVNRHRRYSIDFKRARVKDFESGIFSVAQIGRLYKIQSSVLYRWLKQYSTLPHQTAIIVEVPNSQTAKVKALEDRVALLERALGNKQLELELSQAKLTILAEQGVNVKKKASSTKPSSESAKTNQK